MKLAAVMIYVNDLDKVIPFWVDVLEFSLVTQTESSIKIRVENGLQLNFFKKEDILKMDPNMNVGTPSLMFSHNNIESLHAKLKENGRFVGDIMMHDGFKTFNFNDLDDNYFAVQETISTYYKGLITDK